MHCALPRVQLPLLLSLVIRIVCSAKEDDDSDSEMDFSEKKRKPMMKMAADEEEEKLQQIRFVGTRALCS